jgi:hypothetical protein
MLKAKIKKKQNGKIQKLLNNLNKLSNNNLKVGHFQKSGLHYSGFTYPELLKIWAFGGPTGSVVKNPKIQYSFSKLYSKKVLKLPEVRVAYKNWSKNLLNNNSSTKFFDEIGEAVAKDYSKTFGSPGPFMPIVGENTTPLVETGELKSKISYKNSIDKSIKELNL